MFARRLIHNNKKKERSFAMVCYRNIAQPKLLIVFATLVVISLTIPAFVCGVGRKCGRKESGKGFGSPVVPPGSNSSGDEDVHSSDVEDNTDNVNNDTRAAAPNSDFVGAGDESTFAMSNGTGYNSTAPEAARPQNGNVSQSSGESSIGSNIFQHDHLLPEENGNNYSNGTAGNTADSNATSLSTDEPEVYPTQANHSVPSSQPSWTTSTNLTPSPLAMGPADDASTETTSSPSVFLEATMEPTKLPNTTFRTNSPTSYPSVATETPTVYVSQLPGTPTSRPYSSPLLPTPSLSGVPTTPTEDKEIHILEGYLEYDFFDTTLEREPTQQELDALINRTAVFYSHLFRRDNGDSFESLDILLVDSMFLEDGSRYPLSIEFDAVVVFNSDVTKAPSRDMLFEIMEGSSSDYVSYITDYVWETPSDDIFFEVNEVNFKAIGRATSEPTSAPTWTTQSPALATDWSTVEPS